MRFRFQKLVYLFFIGLAALPNNLEICDFLLPHRLYHTVVESTATKAASHNKQRLLVRIESVEFNALFSHLRSAAHYLFTYRVSRKKYLLLREESLHSIVCNANLLSLAGVLSVHYSCKGVLLLKQYRNLQCCSGRNNCC